MNIEASNESITQPAPIPPSKASAMLQALSALTQTPFESLKKLIEASLPLVVEYLDVESAFVSELTDEAMYLIDTIDQANVGLGPGGVEPLQDTFCQYVRASAAPMVINDSGKDARTAKLATRHKYRINAYMGVPLLLSDGSLYGTLCALDTEAQQFTPDQLAFLQIIAGQIAWLAEREGLLRQINEGYQATEIDLMTSLTALEEQSDLLRLISHDIRNPLTSIIGHSDMMVRGLYGPLNDRQQKALEQIFRSGTHINRLTNDLTDGLAAHNHSLGFITESYDPRALVEALGELYAAESHSRGQAISVDASQAPTEVRGDSMRVQQVLGNLINNALAYTEGVIKLTVTSTPGHVIYQVSDEGPGLPEPIKAQMWQMSRHMERNGRRIGLGLYVTRQLIDGMEGAIEYTSSAEGTTYTITLPLDGPPPKSIPWLSQL